MQCVLYHAAKIMSFFETIKDFILIFQLALSFIEKIKIENSSNRSQMNKSEKKGRIRLYNYII